MHGYSWGFLAWKKAIVNVRDTTETCNRTQSAESMEREGPLPQHEI